MPPRILPVPPRRGRALPPILVISLILCILEATQGWQCFFEVRAMPYRHRVGTNKIRTYPPIATVHIDFFFSGVVCVVLVRQFVHLTDHFFSATQFYHGLSESCITDETILNVQEMSILTLLLDLICSVIFLITFFLPEAVTVGSTFPDVVVLNRKEVKNWLDVLLVLCRIISYEVTARAVDDADVLVRQTLHCALGSTSSSSHSSVFPAAVITSCDSLLKGLNCRCCWRSRWSACRWGWFSIFWIKFWTLTPCDNVLLVDCTVELVVRVKWCNVAMFFRNKLFFHCVCVLELLGSTGCPVSSWACLTRMFSDSLSGFADLSEEPSSLCKRFFHQSRVNGTFHLYKQTSSVYSDFSDRSQIGLGFWLGWSGEFNTYPTKWKQNLRVFWKLMNPPECVWETLNLQITKTILQEKVKIHYSTTIWYTSLFLCLKLWKFQLQKQQWTRNGKIGENFGVELDKSQK